MRYLFSFMIILIAAIFIAGCTSTPQAGSSALTPLTPVSQEIRVDALIPMTGVSSPFGESSKAALLTAEEDINRYYTDIGSSSRIRVVFHDTENDPETALGIVKSLHANNTKIVIGYISSAELAVMKNYTDANGMIVISSGSTAPALSIPDDSIFRTISDDTAQGKIMANYLDREGVRAIVPVTRGDIWGDNLANITKSEFSIKKGVILDGVRYDPGTKDFNTTVAALDIIVGRAIGTYGANSVGVYAVTSGEIGAIMAGAGGKQNLSGVRWFGSDGNTLDPSLTGTGTAARFAARVNMTGIIWGAPWEHLWGEQVTRITERLGREPDSEAFTLYDMLWVISSVSGGTPAGASRAQVTTALNQHLDTWYGISAIQRTNPAGDRMLASYDIYRVAGDQNGSRWQKTVQVRIWPFDKDEDIYVYPGA